MNVVMKIALTIVMMLVWGIGKAVAQKVQGSDYGLLTWAVSLICLWIISDIWFINALFFKNSETNESIADKSNGNEGYVRTLNNQSNITPKTNHADPVDVRAQAIDSQNEVSMNSNEYSEVINEDELYLQATQEVDEGNQDKALWAKCMALCEGDEGKAKYKYIKERVDRLRNEKVKEIEEIRRQELVRREEKSRSLSEKMDRKINFYLHPDNKDKLNNLLQLNNITYEYYRGSYKVTHEGKNVFYYRDIHFFNQFLKEKLPSLKGFGVV